MTGYEAYTNDELVRLHSGAKEPLVDELVERLVAAMAEIEDARADVPSCHP